MLCLWLYTFFHLLIDFILHFSIFSLIFLFIFYPISFGILYKHPCAGLKTWRDPEATQRLCGYIWFEFVLVRCSLHGIEEKILAFRPFSIRSLIRERERSEKMMMKVSIVYSPVTLYSWCRTAIYKSSNWTRTQLPTACLKGRRRMTLSFIFSYTYYSQKLFTRDFARG